MEHHCPVLLARLGRAFLLFAHAEWLGDMAVPLTDTFIGIDSSPPKA